MKKKIILWVSLGLVLLLALAVILLAVLKKDYSPEFDLSPKAITITDSSSKNYYNYFANDNENEKVMFEKLISQYNDSMKQSILASMFSGHLSNNVEISLKSSAPTLTGYKVTLDFKADMTLKKDGKNFVYGTDSSKTIVFSEVMFAIDETKGYHEFNIYAIEHVDTKTNYYEITTLANTYELYQTISGLDFK